MFNIVVNNITVDYKLINQEKEVIGLTNYIKSTMSLFYSWPDGNAASHLLS